jgi:hypothetical protein
MSPFRNVSLGVLLISVASAVAGCGSAIADGLENAHQSGSPPAGLRVVYDDYEPERGGDRIELRGDGSLRGDRWRPGEAEGEGRYWEGRVPERSVEALVQLLVEIRAWKQEAEEEPARLEDRRATLTIEIGDERSSIWEYASDLESRGRIHRVKTHLEALSFEVRHPMADGTQDGFGGDRAR